VNRNLLAGSQLRLFEMNQIAVGVLTVSDRVAQGVYEDLGGPALRDAATQYGRHILAEAIVPDEIGRIREAIRSFSAQRCALILTTGGTGAALRDVTPEAIRSVIRVELPGFGEVMRAGSLKLSPNAIFSAPWSPASIAPW
jgi:molybdopterin adenylyltransferase